MWKKTLAFALVGILHCNSADDMQVLEQARIHFKPLPMSMADIRKLTHNPENPSNPAKVELGKKLYFDGRLSKSGLISCNSCHNVALGGVDNVPASIGHKWTINPNHLNSPTVFNSVFNIKQFWDGRAKDLEEQATGPIINPVEMAATEEMVVKRIKATPKYVEEFQKAFGDDTINLVRIGQAIASFERTLLTPSRFDRFLRGDVKALSAEEKYGLKVFMDTGCTACHTDINLGGTKMEKFPTYGKYKYDHIGAGFKGDAEGKIKVPSLRNITLTEPYLHNGAVSSLEEAVHIMAENQLDKNLSDEDAKAIVSFFNALEGERPYVPMPQLPKGDMSVAPLDVN